MERIILQSEYFRLIFQAGRSRLLLPVRAAEGLRVPGGLREVRPGRARQGLPALGARAPHPGAEARAAFPPGDGRSRRQGAGGYGRGGRVGAQAGGQPGQL